MSWYALEEIEEAFVQTKDLLLPFNLMTWLKLAVIIMFAGAGVNYTNVPSMPSDGVQFSDSDFGQSTDVPRTDTSLTDFYLQGPSLEQSLDDVNFSTTMLVFIAIIGVVVGAAALILGSIFEFIFLQSLIDKKPRIMPNFTSHIGNGLRYTGFRIGILIALSILIGAIVGLYTVEPVLAGFGILMAIPLLLTISLLGTFTSDFILIKMIQSKESLIKSWKLFWPDLKAQWKQVAVYLVVKFLLGIAISLITLITIILATIVLILPFAMIGLIFYLITPVLLVIPGFFGLLTWLLVILLVAVPFRTYVKYYIILVYEDIVDSEMITR